MNHIAIRWIFILLWPFSASWAGEDLQIVPEELSIHIDEKLSFRKTRDEHRSHGYLSDITFTETNSSPKSFIVEGHILHSNNGGPLERVPIYIGRNKDCVPSLAGMTNCDGNFKFRLWVKDDQRPHDVQTTKEFSGYLYAMGSFKKSRFSFGSYTQRYSLKELKYLNEKRQNKQVHPIPHPSVAPPAP